jgi:hypothetical protein
MDCLNEIATSISFAETFPQKKPEFLFVLATRLATAFHTAACAVKSTARRNGRF